MTKGSVRRPSDLSQEEWDSRWDAIFGRDQSKQELKVVFAEGCFDDFDGSPDELAELVAEIHRMAADGTIMEGAEKLSEEEEEILMRKMSNKEPRQ